MYRYDNYTDSFVRIDGEPNTGSTTVRVGVPLKEAVIIEKVELTDECIDKIADAVARKLKTERKNCTLELFNDDGNYIDPQTDCEKYLDKIRPHDPHKDWVEDEPQTDCGWK